MKALLSSMQVAACMNCNITATSHAVATPVTPVPKTDSVATACIAKGLSITLHTEFNFPSRDLVAYNTYSR